MFRYRSLRIQQSFEMDLDNLSDNELRQQLTALGQSVGPLTPSTRTVYIKKLKNLLQMQDDAPVNPPTPPSRRNPRSYEGRNCSIALTSQLLEWPWTFKRKCVTVDALNADSECVKYVEDDFVDEDEDEPLTQLRDERIISGSPKARRNERPVNGSPRAVRSEKVLSGSPKAKPVNRSPQLSFDDGSDGEMGGHESVRYLSPEEMELETTYNNRSFAGSPVVPTPGNIKKVLLALCLLTMVVFVFYLSDRVHRQTAEKEIEDEL
ncbi:unnamed protein product [Cylicocyclus nassatus]|uniref:LEM domain-containing protein n=1 Tax=Cylicocyclus nassatus TaxID=53992 RepID=A0AA36GHM3_CYLNA|nr:unnamed protein product [Cylicocyclus nassatus]